jgi:hypothetical protein
MFAALPPFPTCMILVSVDVCRFATLPNLHDSGEC